MVVINWTCSASFWGKSVSHMCPVHHRRIGQEGGKSSLSRVFSHMEVSQNGGTPILWMVYAKWWCWGFPHGATPNSWLVVRETPSMDDWGYPVGFPMAVSLRHNPPRRAGLVCRSPRLQADTSLPSGRSSPIFGPGRISSLLPWVIKCPHWTSPSH